MNFNKPIKVANIIEEGRIGGPQSRMLVVAASLDKRISTTLIFPKTNSDELQQKSDKLGVEYLLLPLTTLKRDWKTITKYLIFFIFEVIMISILLKKHKFDIVHISGGSWQYKGVLAAKLVGIKSVWHLNDTFVPNIIRKIFSFTSFFADSFIYASHQTKKYYSKLISSNKKNFLIQAPVDIHFFNPNKNYQFDKFLKKKKFKKKIVIGTVANINPAKGLDTFIKAKKELLSFEKDIIFIIVGSISKSQKKYYDYLNNIIKDGNIKDIYFINSRRDVRPLLKRFDIYVCSSDNEASPLSVWEAMSMKKPIVSTNAGDIGKFIVNGVNGYLVNVGDEIALGKKIKKLSLNSNLRKKFGELARKTAIKKLDLKICTQLHLSAYQSIFKK